MSAAKRQKTVAQEDDAAAAQVSFGALSSATWTWDSAVESNLATLLDGNVPTCSFTYSPTTKIVYTVVKNVGLIGAHTDDLEDWTVKSADANFTNYTTTAIALFERGGDEYFALTQTNYETQANGFGRLFVVDVAITATETLTVPRNVDFDTGDGSADCKAYYALSTSLLIPVDVAADNKSIWVSNGHDDPAGQFIVKAEYNTGSSKWEWSTTGWGGTGYFTNLEGISYWPSKDEIVVANTGQLALETYSTAGSYVGHIPEVNGSKVTDFHEDKPLATDIYYVPSDDDIGGQYPIYTYESGTAASPIYVKDSTGLDRSYSRIMPTHSTGAGTSYKYIFFVSRAVMQQQDIIGAIKTLNV